jgi:MFS family permease
VPLIATTLTRDPLLIAGISALAFVPWLLFGVLAGVIVDRVDRRFAMAAANVVRVLVASVIAFSIASDSLTIWLLYACVLVFGMGETVYDNATTAVIPSVVAKRGLERANSRMQAAELVVQNFIATPIAGVLFALSVVIPVISTAAGFLVAAVLALSMPLVAGRAVHDGGEPVARASVKVEASEAISFVVRHKLLRTLILLTSAIGAFLSFAQAASILLFLDVFGVDVAAIGFVTAGVGLGALAGALIASRLVERFGRGRVMLGGSLVAGVGIAAAGFAPTLWLAVVGYAIGAGGVSVWNVPWGALRQDIVPGRLLGRVTGIVRTVVWGLFPIASLVGGLVARIDLRLPFMVGGALMIVASLLAVRVLLSVPDAPAVPQTETETETESAPEQNSDSRAGQSE